MTTSDSQIETAVPAMVEGEDSTAQQFKLGLILRLATFQIGSAMGDILTAGVWNRIMISDFNIPAWPVGLLIALRYFMAPISLWVGHRSDTKTLFGQYRTSYIWLGRGLILLSFPLLGLSTVRFEANTGDPVAWTMAFLCFFMYGLGTLLSGSPFLALVRDSAPRAKQGISIGIVETVLIALYAVVAIGFSRMLDHYDQARLMQLILFVAVVGGFFWFFAVFGVENKNKEITKSARHIRGVDLLETFRKIWGDRRPRLFFVFLFTATFSAWMQDNILEPLGADVFDMAVNQTTRLTGYWATATILVLLASFYVWRKKRPEDQSKVTSWGLAIMGLGMLLVAASAFAGQERLFLMALVIFGGGFGFYTFGGLSLMAAMSPDPNPGTYLGLWTVAILVSKGLGTFMGGLIRDIVLTTSDSFSPAYAIPCLIAGLGLWTAVVILRSINVPAFVKEAAAELETT